MRTKVTQQGVIEFSLVKRGGTVKRWNLKLYIATTKEINEYCPTIQKNLYDVLFFIN